MESSILSILLLLLCSLISEGRQILVIKTVQSKDGEVIDCIDINSQPSLDLPLLKNHTIQMRPSSFPLDTTERIRYEENLQSEISVVDCPSGTIPFLRADYERKTTRFRRFSLLNTTTNHIDGGGPYYIGYGKMGMNKGTRASMTVYEPKMPPGQDAYSGALIEMADVLDIQSIMTGWMVEPKENGDNSARYFVYWGDRSAKKECTNLRCPGFIQVSQKIAVGARITPVSTYDGPQCLITVKLFQDQKTGNWWATFGLNDEPVGYWPKELIPRLDRKYLYLTSWGGDTNALKNVAAPPMGSGHWPSEGFKKAAFFQDISIVNDKNELEIPHSLFFIKLIQKSKCYGIGPTSTSKTGVGFYFGGPGGC